MNHFTVTRMLALVSLLGVAGIALAQDAGTVSFATGSVTAERAPAEALAKGDAVRVADFVVTQAEKDITGQNPIRRGIVRPPSRNDFRGNHFRAGVFQRFSVWMTPADFRRWKGDAQKTRRDRNHRLRGAHLNFDFKSQ